MSKGEKMADGLNAFGLTPKTVPNKNDYPPKVNVEQEAFNHWPRGIIGVFSKRLIV